MIFRKDEIHPSLWRETDALGNRWMLGQFEKVGEAQAYQRHANRWLSYYGKDFWPPLIMGGVGIAVGVVGLATRFLPRPWALAILFAGLVYAIFRMALMMIANLRQVHPEELNNLLPYLDLDPIQRAYAEAVVAAGRAKTLTESEAKETIAQLNRILDEKERLDALQRPPGEDLSEEVATLERKRDEARDEGSRIAYEESLALLRTRMGHRESGTLSEERIAAEKEMIRQSVLSVRDSLQRYDGGQPKDTVLMTRVRDLRRQSEATAKAIQELESL